MQHTVENESHNFEL